MVVKSNKESPGQYSYGLFFKEMKMHSRLQSMRALFHAGCKMDSHIVDSRLQQQVWKKLLLHIQKLSGGEVELKQPEFHTLSKTFASMAWEFGSTGSGSAEGSGHAPAFNTPEKRQKTIENVGLTTEMITLITDAKNANQRLESGCLKLLSKCSDEAEKKKFKSTVLEIKDWISQNESILTWKELPNDVALTPTNFQVFMAKQADATCRLSEQYEQFKALLKARKEL